MLLQMAEFHSFLWLMYCIFFVHLSVDEQLACFHVLAIINNAPMNICLQVFAGTFIFISLENMVRSRTPGRMVTLC